MGEVAVDNPGVTYKTQAVGITEDHIDKRQSMRVHQENVAKTNTQRNKEIRYPIKQILKMLGYIQQYILHY